MAGIFLVLLELIELIGSVLFGSRHRPVGYLAPWPRPSGLPSVGWSFKALRYLQPPSALAFILPQGNPPPCASFSAKQTGYLWTTWNGDAPFPAQGGVAVHIWFTLPLASRQRSGCILAPCPRPSGVPSVGREPESAALHPIKRGRLSPSTPSALSFILPPGHTRTTA